jgi:3-phytase
MKNNVLLATYCLCLYACDAAPPASMNPPQEAVNSPVSVSAVLETEGTAMDGANDPALLLDVATPAKSLVLGSGGEGALEVYSLDGKRVAMAGTRAASLVDVAYNFPLAGEPERLILTYDPAAAELVAFVFDADQAQLNEVSLPMPTEAEIEGLCIYRSPISRKFYAFAAGEGEMQQWELFDDAGRVHGRLVRTVPVGPGAAHCVADDRDSAVYYSQETVGVARLNAEPESEADVEYIDLTLPHGRFEGDVKGVALYPQDAGGFLIVSSADESLLHIYELDSREHVASLRIDANNTVDSADESEGLAAASFALPGRFGNGILIVTDDSNDDGTTNYKLVAWSDVAAAADLSLSTAVDPGASADSSAILVSASVETEPVENFGDAADDPAIWVHPEDPASSLIIGTQKKRGINVYDMSGKLLQQQEDGRINNADLRYGFQLGGKSIDIVTASNRTHDSISIWKVDPTSRRLVDIADGIVATGMDDPYGQCMYKSHKDGSFYVFINDSEGLVRQWQLVDGGKGRVGAEVVREFNVGSQTEGCVADDEFGQLYVGEEDVGIWKYSAEPDGADQRSAVDNIGDGNLTDDVEGLAIIYGPEGKGYLIASNQGADNYAVYEREGNNRFLGHFYVVADEQTGIDGASETDGLDVSSANLGPGFQYGVLVVQDGRNITPKQRQNYKLVPWERIAAAMGLASFEDYDPRQAN